MHSRLHRFWRAEAASAMITFGVCLPVILGSIAAAVDYTRLVATRTRLQQIVDSAALLGAKELGIANMSNSQIASSVQASAYAMAYAYDPQIVATATVGNTRTNVRVDASLSVQLMLAPVIGVSWQRVTATAAASLVGATQLCALTLDSTNGGSFGLSGSARLTAPQCSTDANSSSPQGLQATGSSVLTSSQTCVVGGFSGNSANYQPMPKTGCPVHSDPLDSVVPPSPNLVGCIKPVAINASTTLAPGTYCGDITVNGAAILTLSAGVYIMNNASVHLTGSSQLQGTNVAFYFSGASSTGTFKADAKTTVNLTAPKTGALAGFLIYQDPSAASGGDFHISSANAHMLLGTIYLPQGTLTVDASGTVAEASAYTVVVAQKLAVSGSANLTLNAMYTSTDVPVPSGVGPSGGTVALTN